MPCPPARCVVNGERSRGCTAPVAISRHSFLPVPDQPCMHAEKDKEIKPPAPDKTPLSIRRCPEMTVTVLAHDRHMKKKVWLGVRQMPPTSEKRRHESHGPSTRAQTPHVGPARALPPQPQVHDTDRNRKGKTLAPASRTPDAPSCAVPCPREKTPCLAKGGIFVGFGKKGKDNCNTNANQTAAVHPPSQCMPHAAVMGGCLAFWKTPEGEPGLRCVEQRPCEQMKMCVRIFSDPCGSRYTLAGSRGDTSPRSTAAAHPRRGRAG